MGNIWWLRFKTQLLVRPQTTADWWSCKVGRGAETSSTKAGPGFSEGFSWWSGAFWWVYKISILYPVSELLEQKFNSAIGLRRPKASNQPKIHQFKYFIWFWSQRLSITIVVDTELAEIQQVDFHKAKLFEC